MRQEIRPPAIHLSDSLQLKVDLGDETKPAACLRFVNGAVILLLCRRLLLQ